MIPPEFHTANVGYTRYPDTVACYAQECRNWSGLVDTCLRARLARTRRPQLGDLTEPALIADGPVCAHIQLSPIP